MLLELLKQHSARIDGVLITKIETFEPTHQPEHVISILRWKEKNLSFFVKLTEAGIAAADFYTSHVELEDNDGDPLTLELLDSDEKLVQLKAK